MFGDVFYDGGGGSTAILKVCVFWKQNHTTKLSMGVVVWWYGAALFLQYWGELLLLLELWNLAGNPEASNSNNPEQPQQIHLWILFYFF